KSRHNSGLEPTDRVARFRSGVGKSPSSTARVPLAAGRALGWIAGSQGKAGIVATRPVEADLGVGGCAQYGHRDQPAKTESEPISPHARVSLAPPGPC